MRTYLIHTFALALALTTCDGSPAFADVDAPPSVDDVLGVMARLPPETCLYNPAGKHCGPAGYERGPDARRIAAAIAQTADGSLTGSRASDAALMATFTSYESGNRADAVGDHGQSHGAFQLKYVPEPVANDPLRAASNWLAIAQNTLKAPACRDNPPDERLAGVAGSCTYRPARVKVRQRLAAARAALVR